MEQKRKRVSLQSVLIWGLVAFCTLALVSLCFDEGLDYDEAYSWHTVYYNDFAGICETILDAHDTDIPLWYWGLNAWVSIFGESWFVYKLFAVMGTLASMILGATAVRHIWGTKTAVLFILASSLSPALMHNSVNVRMYSCTVFLVTACGILIYWMTENTRKLWMWLLLGTLTVMGLFCHYFTAFCYLFLYCYLLVRIFLQNKKEIWKVFVCGAVALLPFIAWLIISDFFHLASGGSTPGVSKTDLHALFQYFFGTNQEYSISLGKIIFVMALLGAVLLHSKMKKAERWFILVCLVSLPITCVVMGYVSSVSYHFFIPRHIMHGAGLMWLAIAIVLSRINVISYICGLVFVGAMGISAYGISYNTEYNTTPYMEETKEFIAEQMQEGDIVLYNAESSFEIVYKYYLREQELCAVNKADLSELVGKRVWLFDAAGKRIGKKRSEGYHVTYEEMGHYGFRLSGNNTDFDVYKVEIEVKEP